jgi:hypothetical protein
MPVIDIGYQSVELGDLMNVIMGRFKAKIRSKLLIHTAKINSNFGAVHMMYRHHPLMMRIRIANPRILGTQISAMKCPAQSA